MSYSKKYTLFLESRKPFQITISEEIIKRNNRFYEQEKKLLDSKRIRNYPTSSHTVYKKINTLTETFINKICKKI